jgi:glycosyltransferase involved in cell wall biosynthesis
MFKSLNPRKRSRRIKLLKKYYPRCDTIFAVSNGVARDFCTLTSISMDHLTTIYNPMTTDTIKTLAGEQVNHPWFEEGSPPVILGVGRLSIAKNFPLLIEAFGMVRSKFQCRLVILGDGKLRESIEKYADSSPYRHDIALPGHKINPFAYMSRAAVFAMSSSWEGFGNVLVEAMAVGTPVVSTDCPNGPREILADGKYGPLVPPDDAGHLAEAILGLLQNPTPRDLLIEGSGRFNARTIATRYLEALSLQDHKCGSEQTPITMYEAENK